MGGVDRGDQLRSYHTVTRKSNIWWKQLVYFLIDLCILNAWICTQFVTDNTEALIDGSTEADAQYGDLRIRWQNLAFPVGTPVSHRLERLKERKG